MATIAKLDVILDLTDNAFQRGLQNSRDKLDAWGASLRGIGTTMTAAVTAPVVAGFWKMAMGAADLEQSIGATEVLWGDNASAIMSWSKTADRSMGMTQNQALQSVNTFNAMFKQLNAGTDVVQDMSQGFTQLSADLSAMWGGSSIEASEALTSALRGNYEGLDKYNINLTEAMVSQEAMNIALSEGRDEVTEADKLMARYNLIMEQTTDSQGQFARESDTTSGKLAILRARIGNLATNIGGLLLPSLNKGADLLSKVVGWLEKTDDTTRKWALGIAAAAAAAGPLLIVLGMMLPGLSALLGVLGFLLSPIGLVIAAVGLLAYAFRGELVGAIQGVIGFIGDLIEGWQRFGEGMNPVERGLRAIQFALASIGGENTPAWIASAARAVGELANAAREFMAGNFSEGFAAVGRAAQNIGTAVWQAVTSIDWGGVGGALLDGLASLAGYVVGFVLELPSIAVDVAGWVKGKIEDVWGWLKGIVLGGTQGDGTGGATASTVGQLSISQVAVNVLAWARGKITDLWSWLKGIAVGGPVLGDGTGGPTDSTGQLTLSSVVVNVLDWVKGTVADVSAKIKEWLGAVNVKGVLWWLWLAVEDLTIVIFGEPGESVREKVGEIIVKGVAWSIELAQDLLSIKNLDQIVFWITAPILVAVATMAAIPISIPFVLTLGAIAGLFGLMYFLYLSIRDYIDNNPMDAYEVLIEIGLGLGEIINNLPSKAELLDMALSLIGLGEDQIIRVSIGVVFDFFESDGENTTGGTPIGKTIEYDSEGRPLDPETGEPMTQEEWNEYNEPDKLTGGTSDKKGIGAIRRSLNDLIGVAQNAGSALNTFASTAAASFLTAGGAATTNLPPISALGAGVAAVLVGVVSPAMTGTAATAGTSFGQILSSATSNFTGMSSTATSNSSAMQSGVIAAISGMVSTAGSNIGQMASNAIGRFNDMRNNAQTAGAGIAQGIGSGTADAVSRAGGNLGRLAGIVSSAGSSAAANAYSAGTNIGAGLANGLDAMYARVAAAGSRLANAAAEAIALAAQVKSPSRVTMRLGRYIGEGLEVGIRSMTGDVARASADLFSIPESPQIGGPGFSFASATAPGAAPVTNVTILTIPPDEWVRIAREAERGGTYAKTMSQNDAFTQYLGGS